VKIKDIYNKAVKRGIELDPRGRTEVENELKRAKEDFDELKDEDKKAFDMECLTNPYSDTRILYGDPARDIRGVLVGIDMEVGEILLADPEGRAMAALYEVMGMQAGILLKYGVPINIAEDIMDERIKEVERRLLPANHTRTVDASRLLDIPFMCIHTPSDNAVADYLQKLFDKEKPGRVKDIVAILKDIPEYKAAIDEKAGPKVFVGFEKRMAGKIFVDMTGGTGGSKNIFEKLAAAGIGTVIGMHMGEDHRKEAEKHHINVVIAGHMSSDNLGMNLLLDNILDGVDVFAASGFRRFSRK